MEPSGNVGVAGFTGSADLPVTNGLTFASSVSSGGTPFPSDVFVARFDPSIGELRFATYPGGAANEFPAGLGIDPWGDIIILGACTSSWDLPATDGCFRPAFADGTRDACVARLRPAVGEGLEDQLRYLTYLGGTAEDMSWDSASFYHARIWRRASPS